MMGFLVAKTTSLLFRLVWVSLCGGNKGVHRLGIVLILENTLTVSSD